MEESFKSSKNYFDPKWLDADIIMFLYRDDYYDAQSEDVGLIEIIIEKHKNGKTGTIEAKWYGKYHKVVA